MVASGGGVGLVQLVVESNAITSPKGFQLNVSAVVPVAFANISCWFKRWSVGDKLAGAMPVEPFTLQTDSAAARKLLRVRLGPACMSMPTRLSPME
jgi:hypothetical protein